MYTETDHVMFSINRNIYNMSPTAKAKETSKTKGQKDGKTGGQGCLLGYSNFLKGQVNWSHKISTIWCLNWT